MASVMPDLQLPSQLMLVPNLYCLVTAELVQICQCKTLCSFLCRHPTILPCHYTVSTKKV